MPVQLMRVTVVGLLMGVSTCTTTQYQVDTMANSDDDEMSSLVGVAWPFNVVSVRSVKDPVVTGIVTVTIQRIDKMGIEDFRSVALTIDKFNALLTQSGFEAIPVSYDYVRPIMDDLEYMQDQARRYCHSRMSKVFKGLGLDDAVLQQRRYAADSRTPVNEFRGKASVFPEDFCIPERYRVPAADRRSDGPPTPLGFNSGRLRVGFDVVDAKKGVPN